MTSRHSEPHTETDKQTKPMPGEIDPKNARQKAAEFAAIERLRIRSVGSRPTGRKT